MEVTIRVRRSGRRCVPSEGQRIRRSDRLVWRWLGAVALGTALLLALAAAGRVTAGRSQPGHRAAHVLKVTSLSARRAGWLVAIEGTVRNRSTEAFQYVWVRANFEDAAGRRVSSSDDALLETTQLGPGESASFRLYGVWNPAIARCRVEFTHMVQVGLPTCGATAPVQEAARADGLTVVR